MNDVRKALERLALYSLLLAVNIIFSSRIIPDVFPARGLTSFYLLILSVFLVYYCSHRISSEGSLPFMIKALSWMSLLLILLRAVKYTVFTGVDLLSRHTWYLYYVPILLIPLLLFYISLLVHPSKRTHMSKTWIWTAVLTALFIILVLTNDLHQLIFTFRPGFEGWDTDYLHGWLFYALYSWVYILYIASVIILIIKCRVSSSRKSAWVLTIPFAAGIIMNILLMTGNMPKINGMNVIEFPESLIFTAASVLECCIQLGLIPANTEHGKLFRHFPISAQITDSKGDPVYSSAEAAPLTPEQFTSEDGSRTGEHTVLHKIRIPGGFGFWQVDVTELDRLNEELAEAKEDLTQEAELTRMRAELREKELVTEQRTAVYDAVAERTRRHSRAVSQIAAEARRSEDVVFREKSRNRITMLGSYIKRYANLMLMSQQSDSAESGELALSVLEVLRYLNFCGIPGELINTSLCSVPWDAALAVFGTFGSLLGSYYDELGGVFVSMSGTDRLIFKLTFENMTGEIGSGSAGRLRDAGVRTDLKHEDGVTYISFILPEGGKRV